MISVGELTPRNSKRFENRNAYQIRRLGPERLFRGNAYQIWRLPAGSGTLSFGTLKKTHVMMVKKNVTPQNDENVERRRKTW